MNKQQLKAIRAKARGLTSPQEDVRDIVELVKHARIADLMLERACDLAMIVAVGQGTSKAAKVCAKKWLGYYSEFCGFDFLAGRNL